MLRTTALLLAVVLVAGLARAGDAKDLPALLNQEIVGPRQARLDVEEFTRKRTPRLPALTTAKEWDKYAARIRADVLDKVVFRGEAAKWRDGRVKVEWQEAIEGGPGYRIRKLIYEPVPGLWIPALLYEPEKLSGKAPVFLNVNGHDGNGKAAKYKQARCINMAKRGIIVLNVEWLGMGQLRGPGYAHGRMNQLDLCGTAGLAPFYLCMSRGLDVLLAHDNADTTRVGVSGLSGGGWQTIFISSLDTRVTLSNPVAGYSSFITRVDHHKDLGDSEQTPCDLATVADYTHLTALRAPRPTLLTYNSKDECCFEAGYALPPLMDAAKPVFKLFGKEDAVRSHVNDDPGTHNFEKDNREALYRMIGDHWYPGQTDFVRTEIDVTKELKTAEQLAVKLPAKNADFNSLAVGLAKSLPRDSALPKGNDAAIKWQETQRKRLHDVVHAAHYKVVRTEIARKKVGDTEVILRKDRCGADWHAATVELCRGKPKATVLIISDKGRSAMAVEAEKLLAAGIRVVLLDPHAFGEARYDHHGYLFALTLATLGERPLGIQAGQVAAVARAVRDNHSHSVRLIAHGERSSVVALVAAGLEENAITGVELHDPLPSLKVILEQSRGFDQCPELFCFGLLERFDVRQLVALVAPRPVTVVKPGERVAKELAGLKAWYAQLGKEFDPLKGE